MDEDDDRQLSRYRSRADLTLNLAGFRRIAATELGTTATVRWFSVIQLPTGDATGTDCTDQNDIGIEPLGVQRSSLKGTYVWAASMRVPPSPDSCVRLRCYRVAAAPGVLECAFCGKSKVNTSGSVPEFSISTPPFVSAA